MSAQLWALAVVGAVVLTAAGLETFRAWRARRLSAGAAAAPACEPYILYFTGESCTTCRTHQEPALARLAGVRIEKVDAVSERELADRYHVYTLPTTVVIGCDGQALHVNYGYAPAPKLDRQLVEARRTGMRTPVTA
ncbi:MAG TPA: thioredoxin family protein [Candidatus Dormibacteraeota bacterium]|nr:thioredoxin family protein [Candidatus Dormibacteraeota bacterium]